MCARNEPQVNKRHKGGFADRPWPTPKSKYGGLLDLLTWSECLESLPIGKDSSASPNFSSATNDDVILWPPSTPQRDAPHRNATQRLDGLGLT